jgi:hypothetical protein
MRIEIFGGKGFELYAIQLPKLRLSAGVDGTPLSKPSRSPDCELALVPPLTRKVQMKRRF